MFKDLVESSGRRGSRSKTSFFVSCFVHGTFILILLVVPLLHYETLPAQIIVLAQPPLPPDPPPPPPPPAARQASENVAQTEARLPDFVLPTLMPDIIPPPEISEIPDITALTANRWSVGEGFTGSGQVGDANSWVPRDTLGSTSPPPPPPPPAARKEPVPKGGEVMAAKLVRRIAPVYPELAKRVRVQGPVHLQLRIDELGNVAEIRIMSGHPLLVENAVDAVWKWKYSPTLLNGEPVPVIATVIVKFVLN